LAQQRLDRRGLHCQRRHCFPRPRVAEARAIDRDHLASSRRRGQEANPAVSVARRAVDEDDALPIGLALAQHAHH
jgi:hypothetical protein